VLPGISRSTNRRQIRPQTRLTGRYNHTLRLHKILTKPRSSYLTEIFYLLVWP